MENPAEKQVIERWKTEAALQQQNVTTVQRQAIEAPGETSSAGSKRKRPRRAIEASNESNASGRSQATRTTLDRFIDLEELPD